VGEYTKKHFMKLVISRTNDADAKKLNENKKALADLDANNAKRAEETQVQWKARLDGLRKNLTKKIKDHEANKIKHENEIRAFVEAGNIAGLMGKTEEGRLTGGINYLEGLEGSAFVQALIEVMYSKTEQMAKAELEKGNPKKEGESDASWQERLAAARQIKIKKNYGYSTLRSLTGDTETAPSAKVKYIALGGEDKDLYKINTANEQIFQYLVAGVVDYSIETSTPTYGNARNIREYLDIAIVDPDKITGISAKKFGEETKKLELEEKELQAQEAKAANADPKAKEALVQKREALTIKREDLRQKELGIVVGTDQKIQIEKNAAMPIGG
jgi:hypothetical protein